MKMAFDEHKLIFVIMTTTATKIREFFVKSFSTTKSDKFSMKAQHICTAIGPSVACFCVY